MRLFCTPTITLLIYIFILFIHITAALHRKRDEDASLFEFDEMDSNEDDTYRMIERMQDVSPEDQIEDDEIKEIERMDRKIQDEQLHIQQHESDIDNIPDEDEAKQQQEEEEAVNNNEDDSNNNNDDDLDEEEEEEDDDNEQDDDEENENSENNEEIGPFDFKNDDEAEFFENLPISPQTAEEEEDDDEQRKAIEEEIQHNNSNEDEDEEEELEELDEEEALAQPTMAIPQESKVEAPIPWQRPNPYNKIDTSSFYQDENAIRVVEKSRFKVWHGITVLVILVLVYRSLPRKKNNALDLTWNKDEKDYLPLHNKGRYYKSEIKNC